MQKPVKQLTPEDKLDFEGPEGSSLFWRPLDYCLPTEWRSKVQTEVNAAFARADAVGAIVGAAP